MLRDGSSGGVTSVEPDPVDPDAIAPDPIAPDPIAPDPIEPAGAIDSESASGFDALLSATGDHEAGHDAVGDHAAGDDTDDGPDVEDASTGASVFDFSDRPKPRRPRTSVLGWVSLVLAFLAPPLGLVLSIVARVWARHRHGWRTWPVTLATVVSILMTAAMIVAGFLVGIQSTKTAGVDAIVAKSAAFCASLDETPGVLDVAGYGWPTEAGTIDESIAAMTAYRDRWTELAKLAPSAIASGAGSIADVAATLVSNAESTRSVNRQRNLDAITAATNASGIPAYTAVYCR